MDIKNYVFPVFFMLTIAACNKADNPSPAVNIEETEHAVAEAFGNDVALAGYSDLASAANNLYVLVSSFVEAPTTQGLEVSRNAWRDMRAIWEATEGHLFGPVEDNEYDPKTDTWPTDYQQMNVLLADESHTLDLADIDTLDYSLRGYHPIEYMLWGVNSNKTPSEFTTREKKYLLTLTLDLQTLCNALHTEWTAGFADEVAGAGQGSATFTTFRDLFVTMNNGMIGICDEVGRSDENTGKIYEPFITRDSNIVESPYSENSMTDFKNNINGAYNVYLGRYNGQQHTGLSNIVQLYNRDLDNRIKQNFENALNAFSAVTVSFEQAIFTQRVQLQNLMNAIAAVRDILEDELDPFILQNIKN